MIFKPAMRICLKCGNSFNSTGPGNRICDKCSSHVKHVAHVTPPPLRNGRVMRKPIEYDERSDDS